MSAATRAVQRLVWYPGARLDHRDLEAWAGYEPALLALHIRATHASWGVAQGLQVTRTADQRSAAVSAGFGFTCAGAVVGLGRPVTSAPPGAGAGDFRLVLRAAPPHRGPGCQPAPRCPDTPPRPLLPDRLEWVETPKAPATAGCDDPRDGVPLARLRRRPDGVLEPPDYSVRATVRLLVRPKTRGGSVSGAELTWSTDALSFVAIVDTAEAGFTVAPAYFPTVHGFTSVAGGTLGPWVSVGWVGRSAFELRLGFAGPDGTTAAALLDRVRPTLDEVRVNWIGVERDPGCGPALLAGLFAGVMGLASFPTNTFGGGT